MDFLRNEQARDYSRVAALLIILAGLLSVGTGSADAQSRIAGRLFNVTGQVHWLTIPSEIQGDARFGWPTNPRIPWYGFLTGAYWGELNMGVGDSSFGFRVRSNDSLPVYVEMPLSTTSSFVVASRPCTIRLSFYYETVEAPCQAIDYFYVWFDGERIQFTCIPSLYVPGEPSADMEPWDILAARLMLNMYGVIYGREVDIWTNMDAVVQATSLEYRVDFTAQTAGPGTNGLHYTWDFDGDGVTDSEGQDLYSVSHVYREDGAYSASLQVQNAAGSTATANTTVRIEPKALVEASNTEGFAPLDVNFSTSTTVTDAGLHFWWDFDGDGQVDRHGPGLDQVNQVYTEPGTYTVYLHVTDASGEQLTVVKEDCVVVHTGTLYVSPVGANQYPFASWATAATSIQTAVDAATEGATVMVKDGVYNLSAPIQITKELLMTSANGPETTFLDGNLSSQCVVLDSPGATIDGFTITRGSALEGAGVYAASGTVRNCIITHCVAEHNGGGIYGGTVHNSLLSGNSAGRDGGGACNADVVGGILSGNTSSRGGGAFRGNLLNCILSDNASFLGGGAYMGILKNCLIYANHADHGGGVYAGSGSAILSSTIVRNSATYTGGGVWRYSVPPIRNSIIYFNEAPEAPNWIDDVGRAEWKNSCTFPATLGVENITAPPRFVDAENLDFRLLPSSPCIDAGINEDWMEDATDLDGNPRIMNGTVDMGAYESP